MRAGSRALGTAQRVMCAQRERERERERARARVCVCVCVCVCVKAKCERGARTFIRRVLELIWCATIFAIVLLAVTRKVAIGHGYTGEGCRIVNRGVEHVYSGLDSNIHGNTPYRHATVVCEQS